MRGDDTRPETAGGGQARERSGPRHAAPRKSLLTKLQIPAGKAFALAAMPTAVFVGMGLTPRLALAEDAKDIPFAPGPCVTRSDEPPEESASPSPSGKPSDEASGEPSEGPSGDATDKPEPPTGGGGGDDGPEPSPGETPPASDASKPAAPKEPAPEPSGSKSKDPLDPLGLGDALGDLLGVPDKDADKDTDAGKDDGKDTDADDGKESDKPADPESGKPESGKPADPKPGTSDKPDGDRADSTEDAIRDAADKAGADVEELDDAAKGLDARKDDDIPEGADGKPRFPCPEADPEALAAAELEPGIPNLPDDPWQLETTKLTLRGLDYHGIVDVKTGSGKIKKALKFTASEVDIKDLHQKVVYPGGRTAHVASTPDSTSTIRDGQVTMYTEKLTGNLFGLIPIEFSPDTPPPLNVPFAFFTDAQVVQAGQFGGTLTVPGLHNYITD
ncbi:hypothetical protein [Streptomyces sp. 4R-3d]|uniref:hypothetical protein n=1 Tax=Streptomyces TaxID=1883 RepID=UPI0010739F79|nr:hypothetical protein [Streptomyces sp. 4R-3d]TFI20831.1 hypothetical protein E4P36_35380 [Streptomyces sp. 4R-3d]